MADELPFRRRVAFATIATVLGVIATGLILLAAEGVASLVFSARDALSVGGIHEESHSEYEPMLGWVNQREIHIPDLYGPGISYTTNSQRFRSTVGDYGEKPPQDRYRIIVLGDSVTMGYGVGDDQTYAAQMEALCPTLQVVNMGLGGYGLGQDYLWYMRDGVKIETDLLTFVFFSANFHRMMHDKFLGYGKPILRLEEGVLTVDNVPVPNTWGSRRLWRLGQFAGGLSLGRTAGWIRSTLAPGAQRSGDDTDMFAGVAGGILEELQHVSARRGQDFVAVYLPLAPSLPEEPTVHARWLKDFTSEKGIALVNLTADLRRLEPTELASMQLGGRGVPGVTARRDCQRPDPHYSPRGNRFVAERLLAHLRQHLPDLPC